MTIEEMIAELEDREVDIITYDTWGNPEDGYQVNDVYKHVREIKLNSDGFRFWFDDIDQFEVDDRAYFGENVYEIVELETGKPVGRIEVSVL